MLKPSGLILLGALLMGLLVVALAVPLLVAASVWGALWMADKYTEKRRKQRQSASVMSGIEACIHAHRQTLARLRDEKIAINRYGRVEDDGWRAEVEHFAHSVVFEDVPEAGAYSENSIIQFTYDMIENALGPVSPSQNRVGF